MCVCRVDSLEKILMLGKTEGKRRRWRQWMRWLDSITDSMDMILGKLWGVVEDRGAQHAGVQEFTKRWTQLCDSTSVHYFSVHLKLTQHCKSTVLRSVASNSYNSMYCGLPGSSVHGMLQARILEWVAIAFSNIHIITLVYT